MKTCARCKRELPPSAFYADRHQRPGRKPPADGLARRCKVCISELNRQRHARRTEAEIAARTQHFLDRYRTDADYRRRANAATTRNNRRLRTGEPPRTPLYQRDE